ncbi:hypothetical protein RS584_19820 [Enterobacter sp. DTU_2021_1002640_1_SI_PRY_ASU_LCPMC_013]|uniref:hypothetical protein n=1 Tax=Enterobacter sp. DTU_2021_1002640_1_SI_PRY_ASU_LCPMC_013 TaxID=3077940 RepID=UPI001A11DDE5|nr:hypothetical protein [Enterobacter sp. DTU_2021_1002640_1_SI_PRY_ASU_LCPMC_013]EGQ5291431.1 hypothetical protein [Enterobacter hormaechei]WNU99901.1 hypothetical protein RS584_19820 [Enterobacter sp. DTU_2021_1002640_1_SI_PRY_ASU_LCPMC_013]
MMLFNQEILEAVEAMVGVNINLLSFINNVNAKIKIINEEYQSHVLLVEPYTKKYTFA